MTHTGLTDRDILDITQVLERFPEVSSAILFGSRAKGTQKPASDVDLALKGKVAISTVTRISALLNDSLMIPYYFDVLSYFDIENTALKEHIDRVGIQIYPLTP